MQFINDDFLLQSRIARRLYHEFAAAEPILDFHCHLSPRDIAENRQFRNLHEIWLEGDHYKWRAMRTNGVPEKYCTGAAKPFEKFQAWAATVPHTLRNPLYHWTHLELKRYFRINELLDVKSAGRIWAETNEQLASKELSAQGIIRKFKVTALCTTDDPTDDLKHHISLANSGCVTRVFPAFRPDKALGVHQPAEFKAWVGKLELASGAAIGKFGSFIDALKARHDFFHQRGCRLSDHGMNHCFAEPCTAKTAEKIFARAMRGRPASPEEHTRFATFMMVYFGQLDAAKGWTKQLHLGALRNNNTRAFRQLGPDTGFDSVGDFPQAAKLASFLDLLDRDNALPKTIIYNNNPADNYLFASMIGNYQDGSVPGKLQMGPGWWFLDQKEGMEAQLNALSNLGLLSRFVGMVTDSRSFMSYPRHEYFRRVLCNMVGNDVENGELPRDIPLLGAMVRRICCHNAKEYLNLPGISSGHKQGALDSGKRSVRRD